MNAKDLIDQVEPLLSICVKMADRHNLDEIRISKARAKEILLIISSIKTQNKKVSYTKIRTGTPAWLDNPN
jgi:hypothetical protein